MTSFSSWSFKSKLDKDLMLFVICSVRFWVDFMAWFPFDWIVLWTEDPSISDNFHRWLGLLTLLRMVPSPQSWLGIFHLHCQAVIGNC